MERDVRPACGTIGPFLSLFLPMTGLWGQSQPDPLVTDRPDQTESPSVIQPGFFQFEGGFTVAGEREGEVRESSIAVPQILLRVGLAPRLEARIGIGGWMRRSVTLGGMDLDQTGFGDISMGAKLRLLEGGSSRPEVAVIGTATIPTGSPEFGAERVIPELRFAAAHSLSERVSLGANVGVMLTGVADGAGGISTDTDVFYTAVIGAGLSDRIGAFIEAFGTLPANGGRSAAHSLDAGLTFLQAAAVQFDVAGGIGLTAAAADWFVGAGVSVRVPR